MFFAAAMLAGLLALGNALLAAAMLGVAKASAGKSQAPRPNVPTTRPFAGSKWRSSASAGGINASAPAVNGAHVPLSGCGVVSAKNPKTPAENDVVANLVSGEESEHV